jgi:hypothetical protein
MKNIFKKKFCFLVHEELMLTHYGSLFKLLDKKDFDIILWMKITYKEVTLIN